MDTLNYNTEKFLDLNKKIFDVIDTQGLDRTAETVSTVLGNIDPTISPQSFLREHALYSKEHTEYEEALKKVEKGELELVDDDDRGGVNLLLKKKGSDDPGFFNNYKGGIYIRIPAEVRKETQGFKLPNVGASFAASILKGVGSLTDLAVDLIPDENQEKIANYFKSIQVGDEGESVYSIAENISRDLAPIADPAFAGAGEKAVGELGGILVGGGALKNVINKTTGKAVTKKPSLAREVGEDIITYGTAAVLMTDDDESLVNVIAETFPESKEYIGALVVDPEDPQALAYMKRIVQEGAIAGTLSSVLRGVSRIRARNKAIENDILDSKNLPNDERIPEVNIKEDGGEFGHEVQINQPIQLLTDAEKGKAITSKYDPRRYLTSRQGFDERTFRALNKRSDQAAADSIVIRQKANKLKRAIERAYGIKYKDLSTEQLETLNNALGKELPIGEGMSKKIQTILTKSASQRTDKDKEILDRYYSTLNDAARANQKQALDSLPEELRDTVLEMRRSIDSYSDALSKVGFNKKINATLDAKKGIYMNTEYEAFVNPVYMKKIKDAMKGKDVDDVELVEALDGAREFFKRQLKASPKKGADVDGLMNKFVQSITKKDVDLFDFLEGQKTLGTSRPGTDKVLNTRELIPAELRRVLRQVDDPLQRFSATLKKQTDLIADTNLINDIRKIADDSNYSSDIYNVAEGAAGKFTDDLAGTISPYVEQALASNPLAQVFVKEEFRNMLDKGLEVAYPDNITTKSLAGLGAFSSLAQTVLSEATHLINIKGNIVMMAANGNLFDIVTKAKTVGDVLQAVPRMKNLYGRAKEGVEFNDKDINVEELSKLYRLGLIDNSVTAEMVTKGLEDAFKGPVLHKSKRFIKEKLIDPASNIYRGEDAAFKLLSYYKELDQYAKAFPNMPKEQVEVYAAEVVKNTLPSYSNLPRFIKSLKGAPLGAFPAFFVESIRTAKNIAKISAKDLKKGAAMTAKGVASGDKELIKQGAMLTRIGTRRLAGMGAVAVGGEQYFTYKNADMGIDDRSDKILSSLGPRWENGTTLKEYQTPLMMDKKGDIRYTYVNKSFADPHDVIRKIYKLAAAYATGPSEGEVGHIPFEQYLKDNAALLAPVLGPSLMVQSVTEALTGTDEYGQPLEEGGLKELGARVGAAAKPLVPRTITDVYEVIDLLDKTDVGPTGYPKRLEDKAERLFGNRQVTVDLGKNVRFNAYKINSKIKTYENVFNREISKLQQYPKITTDIKNKLFEKLDTLVDKSRDEQVKLTKLYNDVKSLKYRIEDADGNIQEKQMDDITLRNMLSRQGTEKIDQNFLTSIADSGANTRGTFVPLQIKNKLKKILRELPEDQGEALINEIENRYADEVNIPLIRLVEQD